MIAHLHDVRKRAKMVQTSFEKVVNGPKFPKTHQELPQNSTELPKSLPRAPEASPEQRPKLFPGALWASCWYV